MARRTDSPEVLGYARGAAPRMKTTLTEGHSRFRTSGGEAVMQAN